MSAITSCMILVISIMQANYVQQFISTFQSLYSNTKMTQTKSPKTQHQASWQIYREHLVHQKSSITAVSFFPFFKIISTALQGHAYRTPGRYKLAMTERQTK